MTDRKGVDMSKGTEVRRRLALQQIVGADALADLGDSLRDTLDRDAERKMREAAEAEGLTLDHAVSNKSSEPLVWVEDWNEGGGQLVGLEAARLAGVDAAPSAYLWRYENTASPAS